MPPNAHDDTPANAEAGRKGSASSREILARRLVEATRLFSRPDERLRAEEAEICRCLDLGLLSAEVPETLPDFIGSEHEVWSDGQATLPGSFGRRWGRRRFAFPSEYLRRIQLTEENFGLQWEVLGLVREIGRTRIVTRQPFIRGLHPTHEQVRNEFATLGFSFHHHRLGDFWYRPGDNLLAFDVEPGNLVQTPFGIVPIDVILQNPEAPFPGSEQD
jgi:hypothetical protein